MSIAGIDPAPRRTPVRVSTAPVAALGLAAGVGAAFTAIACVAPFAFCTIADLCAFLVGLIFLNIPKVRPLGTFLITGAAGVPIGVFIFVVLGILGFVSALLKA